MRCYFSDKQVNKIRETRKMTGIDRLALKEKTICKLSSQLYWLTLRLLGTMDTTFPSRRSVSRIPTSAGLTPSPTPTTPHRPMDPLDCPTTEYQCPDTTPIYGALAPTTASTERHEAASTPSRKWRRPTRRARSTRATNSARVVRLLLIINCVRKEQLCTEKSERFLFRRLFLLDAYMRVMRFFVLHFFSLLVLLFFLSWLFFVR